MGDIYIRVIPFPTYQAKGVVKEDCDGNYNIYVNSLLSKEQQIETALHEIRHIRKKHFYRDISVEFAEIEAI